MRKAITLRARLVRLVEQLRKELRKLGLQPRSELPIPMQVVAMPSLRAAKAALASLDEKRHPRAGHPVVPGRLAEPDLADHGAPYARRYFSRHCSARPRHGRRLSRTASETGGSSMSTIRRQFSKSSRSGSSSRTS